MHKVLCTIVNLDGRKIDQQVMNFVIIYSTTIVGCFTATNGSTALYDVTIKFCPARVCLIETMAPSSSDVFSIKKCTQLLYVQDDLYVRQIGHTYNWKGCDVRNASVLQVEELKLLMTKLDWQSYF